MALICCSKSAAQSTMARSAPGSDIDLTGLPTKTWPLPKWHDPPMPGRSRVWMTLGYRLADPVLIVIAVGGEGSDRIGNLVEKRVNHRTIIDFFLGHFDGDDLAPVGIDTDMQLPPGSAAGRAVLFNQPFAGSAELQAGAVHQQMKWAGSCPPEWRYLQRLRPTAERGMVRNAEIKSEQSDDGADQPLG